MERELYLDILRRYWWLVLAVPLLTALIATAAALGRPPRYGATTRLLITRDPSSPGAAGRTAAGEDTTAQDLPAILSGAAFRHDLAAELARRGQPIGEADLAGAISASTSEHAVVITVARGQPEQATTIAQTLIDVLKTGGMRYWGDTSATPDRPGLLVGVLDPPGLATRLDSPRGLALEIGLRALASLGAAAGLAFVLYYIRQRERH